MGVLDPVGSWPVGAAAAAVVGPDGTVLETYGQQDKVFGLASVTKPLVALVGAGRGRGGGARTGRPGRPARLDRPAPAQPRLRDRAGQGHRGGRARHPADLLQRRLRPARRPPGRGDRDRAARTTCARRSASRSACPATALVGPPHRGGESSVGDLAAGRGRAAQPGPAGAPDHRGRAGHRAVPRAVRGGARVRPAGPQRLGPRRRDPRLEVAALDRVRQRGDDVRALRPVRHVPLGRPGGPARAGRAHRHRVRAVGQGRLAAARGRGAADLHRPGSRSARTAARTAACRRRTARSAGPPGAGAQATRPAAPACRRRPPAGRSGSARPGRGCGSRRPRARRRRRARAGRSRPRSTPRCPGTTRSRASAAAGARSTHSSSRGATVAAARIARCRSMPTPARCQSQVGTSSSRAGGGGTRIPAGAGPGARRAVPLEHEAPRLVRLRCR